MIMAMIMMVIMVTVMVMMVRIVRMVLVMMTMIPPAIWFPDPWWGLRQEGRKQQILRFGFFLGCMHESDDEGDDGNDNVGDNGDGDGVDADGGTCIRVMMMVVTMVVLL